ncbi:MAG: hypothetical protein Q9160_008325 [Pyrenula sp. 1 TL-2023]
MGSITSATPSGSASDQSSPFPKPFTIAIVGGGLAGLALAIGLHHRNIPFHIYEAAPAFAEIGAGVIFGPHSVRALGLISPAVLAGFKKCVTANKSPERRNTWLSFRYGVAMNGHEVGDLIAHLEDDDSRGMQNAWTETQTFSAAHRAQFLDELVKLVPKGVTTFGKAVKDIEEIGEQGVRLHFTDGSHAEASAVIGCDGIRSRTRQIVLGAEDPAAYPKHTSEYAYRALVPVEVATEVLGEDLATNGQLYCGPGGYIITYPVDKGRQINMVGMKRQERTEWQYGDKWIYPSEKEDMLKDFEGWGPKLVDLISRFENRDKWASFDLPFPEKKFNKGKICLLGDSAHAATPHLGAGAGMAMEDSFIMSNLIGIVKDAKDLEKVFESFDACRRPRTQRLVLESRRAGLGNEMVLPGVGSDHEKMQKDIDMKYRWVWDEDLEANLREVQNQLKSML